MSVSLHHHHHNHHHNQHHNHKPGQYTLGWRWLVGGLWAATILAIAALWAASTQLGIATWWLGPRNDRVSVLITLLPFLPPATMLLLVINNVRYLPFMGVLAGALIAVVGVFDLNRIESIARAEIALGGGLAVASLVSIAGTYRSAR